MARWCPLARCAGYHRPACRVRSNASPKDSMEPASAPVATSPAAAPIDHQRSYELLSSTRWVRWVAIGVGGLLAVLSHLPLWRVLGGTVALMLMLSWLWGRQRAFVYVLPDGYRVKTGRLDFTVRWSELKRVLHDPTESALYLDCGNPARNLLVPPATGFAFTFARKQELYQQLLLAVGHLAQQVPRIDAQALPAADSPPKPAAPPSEKS